jgi:nucleosome binding factor SPN SPT16 subunit
MLTRFSTLQPFEDPNATFIRGLTYRSTDSFRFTELHKEINDLKRAAVKRENERKEMADVVEQDKLVEIKGASAWNVVLEVPLILQTCRQAPDSPHRGPAATIV